MADAVTRLSPIRPSVEELLRLGRSAHGLQLKVTRARARRSGEYLSPLRGRGMEFVDSRPYEPGDDVRNLHWRVMARTGKPFTKQFQEERERPVLFWVDLRPRMFFATQGVYKSVQAARLASLLAWAARSHGDRTGGVLFSSTQHAELKPGRGQQAALNVIRQLAAHPAWDDSGGEGSALAAGGEAMQRIRRVAGPGSLVVLVSDFHDLNEAAFSNAGRMARHCELLLVQVHDPFEAQLPESGRYRVRSGGGDAVIDCGDARFRRDYEQRFEDHQQALQRFARRHQAGLITCSTEDDPVQVLRDALGGRNA